MSEPPSISRRATAWWPAVLEAVSEAASTGTALVTPPELPDDETLKPITEAVRALLGVLGSGQRLSIRG